MHTSRGYHALLTWLVMQWSRSTIYWSRDWSCTDHVNDHALLTWLIMQCLCSYHILVTWLIMHWSRNWSCTGHVAHHALITWLITHCFSYVSWMAGRFLTTVSPGKQRLSSIFKASGTHRVGLSTNHDGNYPSALRSQWKSVYLHTM